jgi:phosphatidylethanolamine/phosphatidyl-N-methylethanolamine N-methyltransferase
MQQAMTREAVVRSYDRWAPVYDIVFGVVFDRPRRAAIAAASRVGGRILEVGVGTGLSLPLYSGSVRIVGIDISDTMLEQARRRVTSRALRHVESLHVMDAQRIRFADHSFDVVMAQYVVNTIPDPDSALDEFARVLRPGGELIVVNRNGAERGARHAFERAMQPVAQRLGWRSEFPWERFARWLRRTPSMRLLERRPMPPFHHFALMRFGKLEPSDPGTARCVRQQGILFDTFAASSADNQKQ